MGPAILAIQGMVVKGMVHPGPVHHRLANLMGLDAPLPGGSWTNSLII
jgi:hypothetical protein